MRDQDDGSMLERCIRLPAWLQSPATKDVPRHHVVVTTAPRILLGFPWLWNVNWKRPPDFGEHSEDELFTFTSYAVKRVLVAETALAVLLLTGSWIRLAAVLDIAQSRAIGITVASAVAFPGGLLASSGPLIALSDLELGFGNQKLLGGLLLAVVGALVLSANQLGPITGWVAAGLAIVGALSLHAQIGFTDPFLGGGATLAALLLAMAVVALTRARTDAASPSTIRSTR